MLFSSHGWLVSSASGGGLVCAIESEESEDDITSVTATAKLSFMLSPGSICQLQWWRRRSSAYWIDLAHLGSGAGWGALASSDLINATKHARF